MEVCRSLPACCRTTATETSILVRMWNLTQNTLWSYHQLSHTRTLTVILWYQSLVFELSIYICRLVTRKWRKSAVNCTVVATLITCE